VELSDYLRIFRQRWATVLLLALLGVGVAASVTLATPPRYEAFTQVSVSVSSSGSIGELDEGERLSRKQVREFAEVVSTPRVLTSVVNRLNLDQTPEELAEDVVAVASLNAVNVRISATRESAVEAADIANATTSSFRVVVPNLTENQVSVSVVREAAVPTAAISPNIALNVALGLLVGLSIGVGVAVLREVAGTRTRG
jgi:capsular polysaccharide biosynthesis protein